MVTETVMGTSEAGIVISGSPVTETIRGIAVVVVPISGAMTAVPDSRGMVIVVVISGIPVIVMADGIPMIVPVKPIGADTGRFWVSRPRSVMVLYDADSAEPPGVIS